MWQLIEPWPDYEQTDPRPGTSGHARIHDTGAVVDAARDRWARGRLQPRPHAGGPPPMGDRMSFMLQSNLGPLFEKLRSLASAVLAAAPTAGGGIRRRLRAAFERHADGTATTFPVIYDEIDWPRLSLEEWIASFPDYPAVREELAALDNVSKWIASRVKGPDPESVREAGIRLLLREVVTSVSQPSSWVIDERRWGLVTEALRLLLNEGRVVERLLMFLGGVAVSQPCQLGEVLLRPPTQEELHAAFERGAFEGVEKALISCYAVLDASEAISIGGTAIVGQKVQSVVRALRIWTGSRISYLVTLQSSFVHENSGSSRPMNEFPYFGKPQELPSPSDFLLFWQRSREVLARPPSALGVALRRMDVMVDQEREIDRVLDLFIVLEALFQLGGEKQELSYRLSLRVAHFVGDGRAERQAIFEDVKKGYDLRSRIAHGDVGDADRDLQVRLEQIVLRAVRRYCEKAPSFSGEQAHKAIVKELDGFVLERRGDQA
jgi:Apea-like HEPN